MSIFDATNAYVYGYRDIETGMMNIGLKTPEGTDKSMYISSITSDKWWERYGWGKMEQSILFVGDVDTAKTLEWFALGYGTKVMKHMFYNVKNNAHCVNEALLTTEMKQVVIDYIEGNGNGIDISNSAEEQNRLIINIADNIKNGIYKVQELPISTVDSYDKNQVRVELVNQSSVSKIKARLEEDPKLARQVFSPITVVVTADGKNCILDGNTRFGAAKKARGWNVVPVVFINESEFGSDAKTRAENYTLFGLYANKENFEVKVSNSTEDLKRNINNFLVSENLDLSKQLHIDHARQLIYDKFGFLVPSKQQLNGILKSILNDFDKHQAELTYQGNILTYDESFFKRYAWDKYEKNDVATIHNTVSEVANAKVLGYILRRMKNVNAKKGAIILHYTSKSELASEELDKWIPDLIDTIKHSKLPITVDVLPAFKK